MVYGRDITQIPCFRDSLLNGIYGGVVTTILTVMATSKPRLATDVGIGVFSVATIGTFIYCRYQREKTRKILQNVKNEVNKSYDIENKVNE